jgi:hypothetical protein
MIANIQADKISCSLLLEAQVLPGPFNISASTGNVFELSKTHVYLSVLFLRICLRRLRILPKRRSVWVFRAVIFFIQLCLFLELVWNHSPFSLWFEAYGV